MTFFLILLVITNDFEFGGSYLVSSGEEEADLLDEDMDEFEVRGLQLSSKEWEEKQASTDEVLSGRGLC